MESCDDSLFVEIRKQLHIESNEEISSAITALIAESERMDTQASSEETYTLQKMVAALSNEKDELETNLKYYQNHNDKLRDMLCGLLEIIPVDQSEMRQVVEEIVKLLSLED